MRQEASNVLSIELAVALAAQDKKMEAVFFAVCFSVFFRPSLLFFNGLVPLAAALECLEHHRFSMLFCGKDLVHSRLQSSLSQVTLTPEVPKRAYLLELDFRILHCRLSRDFTSFHP